MTISSDEILFLIQRYFLESGFEHSAYTLSVESATDFSSVAGYQIPPGTLITLLQKGLLYVQLEHSIQGQPTQISLLNAALKESQITQHEQKMDFTAPVELNSNNSIQLDGHSSGVYCCCWSSDGKYLATGSSDNSAIIWSINEDSHVSLSHKKEGDTVEYQVSTLDWAPGFLVTGCSDGTAHIFQSDGIEVAKINTESQTVHVVKVDPNGEKFVIGMSSHQILIYSIKGELLHEIQVKNAVFDCAWRDEEVFAIACGNGSIGLVDLQGELCMLEAFSNSAQQVEWDFSKNLLAACSEDTVVYVWTKEKKRQSLVGHQKSVMGVKWSSQGILATHAFDETIRLWDVQSGSCIRVLSQHQNAVFTVSFAPDGNYLMSASSDQTMKLWNVLDGKGICTIVGSSRNVLSLSYDPSGKYIAACCSDGNVHLLRVAKLLE